MINKIAVVLMLMFTPLLGANADLHKHPAEVTQVVVEGESAANAPNAFEKAVGDALRNAVMKAIGVYVQSTEIGSNYQVIKDEILLKSDGFAIVDEVLSTSVKNGFLKVKLRATVSNRPLAEKLKGLGLLHEWKVAVYIVERQSSDKTPLPDRNVENSVIMQLLKFGYRVIDEDQRRKLMEDEMAARAAAGDLESLRMIRREFDVDIFIAGQAIADYIDSDQQGGVTLYRSRASVQSRAYYTDTGEILSTNETAADGLDQSRTLANARSLKNAGFKVGAMIASDIMIAPANLNPLMSVKVTGFKQTSDASLFENALRDLPGVTRVKRHRYSGGVLELDVFIKAEFRDEFPEKIESCKAGAKLGIKVDSWSKSYVQCRVTKT